MAAVSLVSCSSNDEMGYNRPQVCPEFSLMIAPPETPSAPMSSLGNDAVKGVNRFAVDFYLANSGRQMQMFVCLRSE